MKLKNLVTSLRLSKRLDKLLKEKGIEVETQFYWVRNLNALEWGQALSKHRDRATKDGALPKEITDKLGTWVLIRKEEAKDSGWGIVPAFLSGELGELLPDYINPGDFKGCRSLLIRHTDHGWIIEYGRQDGSILVDVRQMNLSECFGLMLEYLLKNDLMKKESKEG